MHVTISREPLLAAMAMAVGVVNARPANPVLAYVQLRADNKAGLHIRAMDFDVEYADTVTEAEVKAEGAALTDAKALHALLRDLTCDTVSLKVAGNVLELRATVHYFELPTADPAEFPADTDSPKAPTMAISAGLLAEVLGATAPYAAKDKGRYALNCVAVVPLGDHADFFGATEALTSIRRVAAQSAPVDFQVLIPPRLAALMAKQCAAALPDTQTLLHMYENRTVLQVGRARQSGQSVYGTYPDVRSFIPKADKQFKVRHSHLRHAITLAKHMSTKDGATHGVFFDLVKDQLELTSASAARGKASVKCEAAWQGPPVRFCMSPDRVSSALDILAGHDELTVEFADPEEALQFHAGDPLHQNVVVAPIYLQDS